ncbi:acyl-CoA dehydrogenase family protein [Nocardia sp. NRRL S-836]|uniref:acyl-CoA dehydrogenase family protein n=1 Tax=Nocardia sp. NRRL S-836 TaxID=1519492 RepID=UPI0006ADDE9C|nr:acyl-CoA dehydrogenase family protein [Nocardia sp. NRRL S-836]KOV86752.1 acyl-CoA dehydrogenase [Nocardia sp. NRRL S-836]
MEHFRREVREWLSANLVGEFAALRGLGGPGREHEAFEGRLRWDRHLAAHGWTALSWPGGRTIDEQVVFHEEYARADAPARVNVVGEGLLGPTLCAFGTPEQQRRFLPKIRAVDELWCQGYSEPGAGSDLASVSTRAELVNGRWVVTGQKIWTSLAHVADWCFVLARTEPGSQRHHGLSYLLVPMDQPGVEVRPIRQLTGTSEFNEVFFDGAVTAEENVVGRPGEGWKIAMATLGFERGVAMLGHQVAFRRELDQLIAQAPDDPILQDRLTRAWLDLHVMRSHTLRTLGAEPGPEASVLKLFWSGWHKRLGELAMDVLGPASMLDGNPHQATFLFSRAETIYGGSDEVQREIIAHRVLGLPR